MRKQRFSIAMALVLILILTLMPTAYAAKKAAKKPKAPPAIEVSTWFEFWDAMWPEKDDGKAVSIKLMNDIMSENHQTVAPVVGKRTIDLNGYTLGFFAQGSQWGSGWWAYNGADFTIKGPGTMIYPASIWIHNGSKVTVDGDVTFKPGAGLQNAQFPASGFFMGATLNDPNPGKEPGKLIINGNPTFSFTHKYGNGIWAANGGVVETNGNITFKTDDPKLAGSQVRGVVTGTTDIAAPGAATVTVKGNLLVEGAGENAGVQMFKGAGHAVTITGDVEVSGSHAIGAGFWKDAAGDVVIDGNVTTTGKSAEIGFDSMGSAPANKEQNITVGGIVTAKSLIRINQAAKNAPLADTTKKGYITYGGNRFNVWIKEPEAADD